VGKVGKAIVVVIGAMALMGVSVWFVRPRTFSIASTADRQRGAKTDNRRLRSPQTKLFGPAQEGGKKSSNLHFGLLPWQSDPAPSVEPDRDVAVADEPHETDQQFFIYEEPEETRRAMEAIVIKFRGGQGLNDLREIDAFLSSYIWQNPNRTVFLAKPMTKNNPMVAHLTGQFIGDVVNTGDLSGSFHIELDVSLAESGDTVSEEVELTMQVKMTRAGVPLGIGSLFSPRQKVKYIPETDEAPPITSVQINPGSNIQLFYDPGAKQWIGNLYLTNEQGIYRRTGIARLRRTGE
jgi:hypothetical protein